MKESGSVPSTSVWTGSNQRERRSFQLAASNEEVTA
jgi:hypothetical protein